MGQKIALKSLRLHDRGPDLHARQSSPAGGARRPLAFGPPNRLARGDDRPSPAETALPVPRAGVDRVGVAALLVGTAIIAWSGVLARFLDVGPLAGAAWRMGLAVPALAVWARFRPRGRTSSPALAPVAGLLILAGPRLRARRRFVPCRPDRHESRQRHLHRQCRADPGRRRRRAVLRRAAVVRVWPALALALVGSWVMAGMTALTGSARATLSRLSAAPPTPPISCSSSGSRVRLDGPTATLWSAAVSAVALAFAALAARREDDPARARSAGRSSYCSASSRTRWARA